MPMYAALFPIRILNNVILLPIEADIEERAERIIAAFVDPLGELGLLRE